MNGLWKHIPVPSRLYTYPTTGRPLAGSRMGIKIIFRLAGTQLIMMSRPWIEIYGPDEESADYIKKLIDLGAVIVGKTKMTSFASPEEPTDQWIDFHCPVNPRGDGYQSPSSSSTGAGTSLAGYEWLDFSIAGDCENSPILASRCVLKLGNSGRECTRTGALQRAVLTPPQLRVYLDERYSSELTVWASTFAMRCLD